ncbi:MAG: carbon-nitrogen hydrolase family protein [Bacteroidota bacterium]
MQNSLKLAIAQVKPAYMDLAGSLQKLEQLTAEAAENGAKLMVFGETWLTGYPAWLDYLPNVALWDHEPTKAVFARMHANSLRIPSEESRFLESVAKKYGVTLMLGANEAVHTGTIYNVLLGVSPETGIAVHHRKLMPTYTEKLLYTTGDGQGLHSMDTDFGKLSGLICWEHWMPLARQTMHESGEVVHVAVWPRVHEMHQVASRQYAFEGRCFVIAVGQMLAVSDLPEEFDLPEELQQTPDKWVLDGGSCVIAPDGKYLLEPQFGTEGLLYVDIPDLGQAMRERVTLDVCGHYARPDVFDFSVNRERIE